jgi:predicted transcriptional regulator
VPSASDIAEALRGLGLKDSHIVRKDRKLTKFGLDLLAYFKYRATALREVAQPHLMYTNKARATFRKLKKKIKPKWPVPMNKQKGNKRARAYFTGIINMLIESNAAGLQCDYSPTKLTSVTVGGAPIRTLARRVDGAFPTTVNPVAVWEIKEYYYTTTFGSRIADGVYISLLDGMELEELRKHAHIDVKHYLMVDAYRTWWNKGKSYLCRIVDMLHMGYIDEALFGWEVLDRLPVLVKEWAATAKKRATSAEPQ